MHELAPQMAGMHEQNAVDEEEHRHRGVLPELSLRQPRSPRRVEHPHSPRAIRAAFAQYDRDRSGYIDHKELRAALQAKKEGRPYSIVFIGVNGVGKSTSLSKVCYYLLQKNLSVSIAACDTFRSGAVEQLKVHGRRLGVEIFEQVSSSIFEGSVV